MCAAVVAWVCGVVDASALPIWRVDFNGSAADTLPVSNFAGWVVSNTSRTQTFANVDGGPESTNLTVALLGTSGSTWSTFQRTMNPGVATNLYRDGAQYNADTITVSLSQLEPGAAYAVRLWFFDDEFSIGTTQTYTDVTGAPVTLGSLTNIATANRATGHADLPSSLYDPRYSIEANLIASGAGVIAIQVTASSGNAKWNALEVRQSGSAPPALSWDGIVFVEAPTNNGTIGNTLGLSLARDTFTGTNGEDFIVSGKAVAGNVPGGLTATLTRVGDTSLTLALLGQATDHAAVDSVNNLTLTLLDAAFASGVATQVAGYTRSNAQILFNDAPLTNGWVFSWDSIPGARYSIEYAAHPTGTFTALRSNILADMAWTTSTSPAPPATASTVLFRIRVEN